jgi:hypothetical protein
MLFLKKTGNPKGYDTRRKRFLSDDPNYLDYKN